MTYSDTIDYLYSRLPMFTKIGASAIKKDLTNTLALCEALGNPHRKFKTIHVAGTNGKGSVSHMLAAILQEAGYKTGLYTSPHLLDFRERIRINGQMIARQDVVEFVNSQRSTIEAIEPSFFEVTVAMAFDHFASQEVDIAVIETGLGGRLDSTNVITPLLSVITNIGYDHMNILGNTLEEIASEKAGIIKPGIPIVISQRQEEIEKVFLSKAIETGSDLRFGSDEWDVKEIGSDTKIRNIEVASLFDNSNRLPLQLDLTGTYQVKNIKGVLSSVSVLRNQGFDITNSHLRQALGNVQGLTGLNGRWQTIGSDPLVICDTGHNEDGIKEVLKNISTVPFDNLYMVIGMVKDKDSSSVLSLLPKEATYYFCAPLLERAKPAEALASEAAQFGLQGKTYSSVRNALDAAKVEAGKSDLIFVGGSTFVVAEAIEDLQ
ncbi:bifunctional folylpolyglutamate synthase/dihydrofolate synthase [Desertivirga brevis]|uniref:bifunctional folylpolyglutamate synthase/dihydrofolate synthase n=1 Tax=Desertivirga brevis TaxID=2810310 RepID=UPI001A9611FB|nr:folylpolyglutamate synthase/dihydrofolate synthase family protein [Pedobacter sp. SYSU D00873]